MAGGDEGGAVHRGPGRVPGAAPRHRPALTEGEQLIGGPGAVAADAHGAWGQGGPGGVEGQCEVSERKGGLCNNQGARVGDPGPRGVLAVGGQGEGGGGPVRRGATRRGRPTRTASATRAGPSEGHAWSGPSR